MGIGKHLEARLSELGWDQKRLVAESKLAQQTVSAIIRRDSQRSKYTDRLAAAVFLTSDQLIIGVWPKLSSPKDATNVVMDAKTKDREQLMLALIRTMTPEQQEALMLKLRAAHAANLATAKHVKGLLQTIGNRKAKGRREQSGW